jgi:hypothetical protein
MRFFPHGHGPWSHGVVETDLFWRKKKVELCHLRKILKEVLKKEGKEDWGMEVYLEIISRD